MEKNHQVKPNRGLKYILFHESGLGYTTTENFCHSLQRRRSRTATTYFLWWYRLSFPFNVRRAAAVSCFSKSSTYLGHQRVPFPDSITMLLSTFYDANCRLLREARSEVEKSRLYIKIKLNKKKTKLNWETTCSTYVSLAVLRSGAWRKYSVVAKPGHAREMTCILSKVDDIRTG